MMRCLLYELASMSEYERLIGILGLSLDSINQSCKYDLLVVSITFTVFMEGVAYTVLPLPVARDMPNRLCPLSR